MSNEHLLAGSSAHPTVLPCSMRALHAFATNFVVPGCLIRPRADVAVVRLHSSGGVVARAPAQRKTARTRRVREYFYGARGDLSPHSQTVGFDDLRFYRVGGGPRAPSSALPIGASRSVHFTWLPLVPDQASTFPLCRITLVYKERSRSPGHLHKHLRVPPQWSPSACCFRPLKELLILALGRAPNHSRRGCSGSPAACMVRAYYWG